MEVGYAALKSRSEAVANAIAAERSARNLASRRKAVERADERAKTRDQLEKKRRDDRDAKEAQRPRIRVKVDRKDRPRYRAGTPRRLYHRRVDTMLKGTTGLTDARGPDRLYSIHYAFTARGLRSTKGRRWRTGEAERAALYCAREDALEGGERGWWSNIADDRNELAAHYRASEALEKHDRANANVYISEVIALPAELTARQRRRAVRRICRWFEERGLPYTVGVHLPDQAGDQRNYHCHIVYSLRPCERIAPYEWSFAAGKVGDINTPAGIRARRLAVVRAINTTLHAAGIDKRYTHRSNKARNMAPPEDGKVGQQVTWARRRLAAMTARRDRLDALVGVVSGLCGAVSGGIERLDAAYQTIDWSTHDMARHVTALADDTRIVDQHGHVDSRLDRVKAFVMQSGAKTVAIHAARQIMNARADHMLDRMTHASRAILHDVRGAVVARLNRMAAEASSHGEPAIVRTVMAGAGDRLARIAASLSARIEAGTARIDVVGRWIDRAAARDDINVALMEAFTAGALRLADARSTTLQRLDAMVADTAVTQSPIDDARAGVEAHLRAIRAAINPRAAIVRGAATRLYMAKSSAGEPSTDSAAMRAIRAHMPPPRDNGVERLPPTTAPMKPEADETIVKPPADTLSNGGDHALVRALAVEREHAERETAWKRLVKSRAVVAHDGERYAVDMAALTEVERRLLSRPGFTDEFQRRLRVLFERQTAPSASDSRQAGEEDADLATQHMFRRGSNERK